MTTPKIIRLCNALIHLNDTDRTPFFIDAYVKEYIFPEYCKKRNLDDTKYTPPRRQAFWDCLDHFGNTNPNIEDMKEKMMADLLSQIKNGQVNAVNYNGETALTTVINMCDANLTKILLEHGALIDNEVMLLMKYEKNPHRGSDNWKLIDTLVLDYTQKGQVDY